VFPFYFVALAIGGLLGQNTRTTQYLGLLRLFRLARLHRVKKLFDDLQWNTKVSFIWFTLVRNFGFALIWTHFSACVMFFIAKQMAYDPENIWIGEQIRELDEFDLYVRSLYWSVVTFATVGYGDFSPANTPEQIWGIIYIFLNMVSLELLSTARVVLANDTTGLTTLLHVDHNGMDYR
jgi:hypothetical protein